MRRYGVFKLGQIWSVIGDDGIMRGFASRPHALAAAEDMLDEVRSYGAASEAVIQDETGRLITTDNPARFIGEAGLPHGTVWEGFAIPAAARKP